MPEQLPQDTRRGQLRNGNRPGDFGKAARCGARTRRGNKCECPAMKNGRCRLHGGLSTGARTAEGIERIRRANTKHGRYAECAIAERKQISDLFRQCRSTIAARADSAFDERLDGREGVPRNRII